MKLSLRYKAAVLIALTELALLSLLVITNLYQTREDLEAELLRRAGSNAELVAASATEPLLGHDLAQLNNLLTNVVGKHQIVHAEITDHRGRRLAAAGASADGAVARAERPIEVAGTRFGAVRLEVSRAETEAALAKTTRFNIIIVSAEMLLVALISLSLGWFLTRHLDELTRGTEALARRDFRARVPVHGQDELGTLAARFNDMAGELERSEAELLRSHHRFRDMADNVADWVWETDADARFTYCSNKVGNLLGFEPPELLGRRAFDLMHPDDAERLERLFVELREQRQPFYGFEFRARHRDGMLMSFEANGTPILDEGGALTGYRGVTRDITRRKEDESRLVYLAEHDVLTGLLARAKFLEVLEDEVRLSHNTGQPLTLLIIDLDDFKLINDTHGHLAGDALLRLVADTLRSTAGEGTPVARLGGDEFGVLRRGTSAEGAALFAQLLLDTLAATPLAAGGTPLRMTASLGVCVCPLAGLDAQTLLAHADMALSRAKGLGHNRYHLYQRGDREAESMRHTVNWQGLLHEALGQQRIALTFQPMMRVSRGSEPMLFEALACLHDRDGRLQTASHFIPTAEYTGQVADLDLLVLARIADLLDDERHGHLRISMNVSGRSLGSPGFSDAVEAFLKAREINPQQLIFEITETAAVAEMARASSFIGNMKRLGYRFALDDFGVGFSSFSYLKHLPADILKIDGSFIRHLDRNREDEIFVRAILQVARELGLQTVAEYVESQSVYRMLCEMGVDYVQGLYIGKPDPAIVLPRIERPAAGTEARQPHHAP